jgi:hypothetical protein
MGDQDERYKAMLEDASMKLKAENANLRAEVEALKDDKALLTGQLQQSRKHVADADLQKSEQHRELIRVTNMLNTAVPHGPADPDDPCPADCRRCAIEKKFPYKRKLPPPIPHGQPGHDHMDCM